MRKYSVYQDYFKLADVVKVKDENEMSTADEYDIMEHTNDTPSGFQVFDPTKFLHSSSKPVNREKHNLIGRPKQETVTVPVYGNRMRTTEANMETCELRNSPYFLLPKNNEGSVVSASYSAVNRLCELMKTRDVPPCRERTVATCRENMEGCVTSQLVPVMKMRKELISTRHPVLQIEQIEPRSSVSVPAAEPFTPPTPYVYDRRETTVPVTHYASGANTSGPRTVGVTTIRKSELYCQFCKRNGETPQFYKSHVLKDSSGKVRCPVLRSFRCPICNSTGDNAHTITYCPFGSGQPSTMTATRTPKKSCGCPREFVNKKNHCHDPVFSGQSLPRHFLDK